MADDDSAPAGAPAAALPEAAPATTSPVEPAETAQPAEEAASAETAPVQSSGTGAILPASHWADVPLPAEEARDDDQDSAYDDEVASSTASLSASILEYRNLHGRTFHSEFGKAESWIPNDDQQQESMDIHHHMCTLAMGDKLFLSPIKDDVQKVVDIGTGTGIWAIDFADMYPNAEVIGTDLSPIQPSWVPPGVKFELDDANQPWTWADNTFDFVHVRCLFGSIVDWSALYREAFRTCKPGGWFEDFENSIHMKSSDGSIGPGSPMAQWGEVFKEGGRKFGRTFEVLEDDIQRKCMEEAGFVDIQVWDYRCPIGSWMDEPRQKTLGAFSKMVLDSDAEGYVLYMWSAVMGWSNEEVQVYLAHLRRQLRDKNTHGWYDLRTVYGRKPMPGEVPT